MTFIRSIIKSKLVKNGFWLLVLQVFNTVVPLLTLPYITRILSESDYGSFSLALNWIGYFQVVVEYGFALYGTKMVATCTNSEEISRIRSTILFARLLLFCVCIGSFFLCIMIVPISEVQFLCMIILFIMVLSSVFQQTWLFQGLSEMKSITVINVISRIVSLICIFLFVRTPDDVYWYTFFYSVNFLMARILEFVIANKKFHVAVCRIQMIEIVQTLRDAWSLFISSAMTRIFSNIGITILGFITLEKVVGAYAAIVKIPYILTLLFTSISQALYPHICQAFNQSFEQGYAKVKRYGVPVFFCFAVGGILLSVFHFPIVKIAFGESYAEYSLLIIPFVAQVLLGIANNFLGIQTLVASGNQKQYSIDFLISVVVMLMLMLVLGNYIGAYGIAFASMLSELFLSVLLVYHVKKQKDYINKEN